MGEFVRRKDWSQTPLGPIADWPAHLRIAVSNTLDSPLPTVLLWGEGLIQIYNDSYRPFLGARHPEALGQRTQDCWPEVWHFNEPVYRQVMEAGARQHFKDQEFAISPSGVTEVRYFTVTYSPSRDQAGQVCGVSVVAVETTETLLTSRANDELMTRTRNAAARQAFQLTLSDTLRFLRTPDDVINAANELLGRQLQVSRVMYAEVDEGLGTFVVRRDWTRDGLFSMTGDVRRLDDFGPEIVRSLRAGEAMVIDNIALDPRTAHYADAYAQIEVRANLAIPLVKSGEMIAILSLHNERPREWAEAEIELVRETAERMWASVEKAKAQADLQAERDLSQHVFDSMAEGIAILDREWRVLKMNAEGLRLGERVASEVIGRSHWEIWPETVGTELEVLYRQVMNARTAGAREYCHVVPQGRVLWIEVRAYPIVDGGIAIIFRDINSRKAIEKQLQEGARHKDEFLAMLAHELRNPLAPISAAALLLKLGPLDEAGLRHTSAIIGRQVQHMSNLLDDLLDVSRVSKGLIKLEQTTFPLQNFLAEAVEQVNPLILARGHHLTLHLTPDLATMKGDRKRLIQVIANLLANAAKFTPPGGEIVLTMATAGDEVVLSVDDNGIGMTPDLTARVFDLFTQAERTSDRSAGGLGLGLTLVKSLTELHGGTVTCFSEGLGQGSRFTVRLPKQLEPGDEPVLSSSKELLAPGRRSWRVMIVDDNTDAALALSMLLTALGHSVFAEHGSRRALERARAERPEVCLLDIGLPEMDGNELAQHLRALPETAGAMLIAVTGYGQDHDRETSLAAGFDYHLVKPLDVTRLVALLAEQPASVHEAASQSDNVVVPKAANVGG